MNPTRVLYADPAWPETGLSVPHPNPHGKAGRADRHYGLMTEEAICSMELPPLARDGWVFMWTPARNVERALRVMRAWGYRDTGSSLVWVKTQKHDAITRLLEYERKNPGFVIPEKQRTALLQHASKIAPVYGMGYYARISHEIILIGRRGKPGPPLRRNIRSVVHHPRGKHSEKPAVFASIIEQWSEGPYTELFARQQRPGWTCLGNELGDMFQ